jgi:hypothetical protein
MLIRAFSCENTKQFPVCRKSEEIELIDKFRDKHVFDIEFDFVDDLRTCFFMWWESWWDWQGFVNLSN